MLKNISIILFSLVILSSCAGQSRVGTASFTMLNEGLHVNNNGKKSEKKGESCTHNILSILNIGDASIAAAKKDGMITQVNSVERRIFGWNYPISIYGKACTVIKGS